MSSGTGPRSGGQRAAGWASRAGQPRPSGSVGSWGSFPGGSELRSLLPRRLQGTLEPGRGGGPSREGLRVPGGVLQTQVPRAARKVSPGPTSGSPSRPPAQAGPPPALQTRGWVRRRCPSSVQGQAPGPTHTLSHFPAAPPKGWALCRHIVGNVSLPKEAGPWLLVSSRDSASTQ